MKRESREVEEAIRRYVRRPFSQKEKRRLVQARIHVQQIAVQYRSPKVVIEVYNKQNPNGFTVTFLLGSYTWKVERFVNISWMRRQVAPERNAHGR